MVDDEFSDAHDLEIAEHLLALALNYRKYGWDDLSAGTSPRNWETGVESWLLRRKYKAHNETPTIPKEGPIMAQQDRVHNVTDLPKERKITAKRIAIVAAIAAIGAGIVLVVRDAMNEHSDEELANVETETAA